MRQPGLHGTSHSLLLEHCSTLERSLCCVTVAVVTAGGLGGMLYWLVIFPVDVIKSAMQTDAIVKADRKYPDMVTTAQVRTEPELLQQPSCRLWRREHALRGSYERRGCMSLLTSVSRVSGSMTFCEQHMQWAHHCHKAPHASIRAGCVLAAYISS